MMHDEEFLNEAIKKYEESKGIHSLLLELKGRRDKEKEYAVTSTPPSDKNPAGAICEPLKELIKLRAENKKLNEMIQGLEHELDTVKDARPAPCTKFCDASKKEWVAKLNEEAGEVVEALYDPTVSREDCLREMVDVATVARSMAYAAGYTLGEWEEMQRWVNDNNRRRGYMDEPVR